MAFWSFFARRMVTVPDKFNNKGRRGPILSHFSIQTARQQPKDKLMKTGYRSHLLFMAALSMILTSCQVQVHTSTISETIVGQTEKTLRENATPDEGVDRTENIVLLGKSAAVYRIVLAEGIPKSAVEDLSEHLNNRLTQMPFYSLVRTTSDLDVFFAGNKSLNQMRRIYIDSLARVSVSNKDISNRLGKALDVDNLIFFQVDRWPCPDCKPPLRIRLKLRVIDLASGMIIWNGINELRFETSEEASYDQLIILAEELLSQMEGRFERKWHRKRFRNLTLLARN